MEENLICKYLPGTCYSCSSAYNSKFQHLRHEDKITSQQDNELSASGISSNEKETDNNDTDGIEE
ncbi:9257_t:CDS:2, partial [Funneliformis geosporum]